MCCEQHVTVNNDFAEIEKFKGVKKYVQGKSCRGISITKLQEV